MASIALRRPERNRCRSNRLRSYGAAFKDLGRGDDREMGRWLNNRAEYSHLPFRRRERAMLRFRRMRALQKFASIHASVYNHFPKKRHLQNRGTYKLTRAAATPSGAAFLWPDANVGWGLFIITQRRDYFWRGSVRSAPGSRQAPLRCCKTATARLRAALRTSSWMAWSRSNARWLVA